MTVAQAHALAEERVKAQYGEITWCTLGTVIDPNIFGRGYVYFTYTKDGKKYYEQEKVMG